MKSCPVLMKPALKPRIWGGDLLYDNFGKGSPGQMTGESWELSAHPGGNSVVASGEHSGMEFGKYLDIVLGGGTGRFPLLVKLIGPSMDLSVQVHPGDNYSGLSENESGKSEAWYVLSAPADGRIICGVNCGKEDFARALDEGRAGECLKAISVTAGDVVYIKPGLVHALCAGVTVYEVQQNSDITYRLFDYNRVDPGTGRPRQLHIESAMDVIDFSLDTMVAKDTKHCGRSVCVQNSKFILESIHIDGRFFDDSEGFGAYTVVSGRGSVLDQGNTLFEVNKGDTFFAPVCGDWELNGTLHILKAGCPDEIYNI